MNRNVDRDADRRAAKERAKWESIPWSERKALKICAYWSKKLGPNFNPHGPMPHWRGACSRNYVEDMIFLLGFPGLDIPMLMRKAVEKPLRRK